MATRDREKIGWDPHHFVGWNEEMARIHTVEGYLNNSSFLIRYVERHRINRLVDLLAARRTDRVLEMGCGPGFVLHRVPADAKVGVDLAHVSLRKAREFWPQDRIQVAVANGETLPFSDESFDRVICTEVIEHVQHPPRLLTEMMRVLRPGGKAVLTVPNDTLIDRGKQIFTTLRLDRLLRIEYGGGDEWHLHVFSRRELAALFHGLGIRVERLVHSPSALLPLHWIFVLSKD